MQTKSMAAVTRLLSAKDLIRSSQSSNRNFMRFLLDEETGHWHGHPVLLGRVGDKYLLYHTGDATLEGWNARFGAGGESTIPLKRYILVGPSVRGRSNPLYNGSITQVHHHPMLLR